MTNTHTMTYNIVLDEWFDCMNPFMPVGDGADEPVVSTYDVVPDERKHVPP